MTANRLTSFLLMVIVFSPITDIFSDALWDDNITDAQHPRRPHFSFGQITVIIMKVLVKALIRRTPRMETENETCCLRTEHGPLEKLDGSTRPAVMASGSGHELAFSKADHGFQRNDQPAPRSPPSIGGLVHPGSADAS